MTENQEKEMFNLLTNSVSGIQDLNVRFDTLEEKVDTLDKKVDILQQDVSELKSDVSELKDGQKRLEKEMRLNSRVVNSVAGEQARLSERVTDLEKASV